MIHRFVKRDRAKTISEEAMLGVIKRPVVTEKAFHVASGGCHVFEVMLWANKFQIAKSVEKIFGVKVESVTTSRLKGKVKRFRGKLGQRSDQKKAMVRLEKGQTIDVAACVEKGFLS